MKIFNSARAEIQSVNDLFTEKIQSTNSGIKHVFVSPGALGDSTIFVAICYTPRPDWSNGIFENSNYARFHIDNDGSIECFVTSLYSLGSGPSFESRLPIKKFRKSRSKSLQDAINKIANWSLTVETFYQ